MTSIVDSKAHFSKRCLEIGMTPGALASLVANGYETSGMLAFAIGQPGVPLVDDSIQAFARNTFGAGAAMADVTALKRMVFESHTMVLAQLREQVSNPEASSTRKLPAVEREAKMRALRARLTGVVVEHQLEPSHALLDIFAQQWESRQLEYVNAEKCTSREWEVMKHKSSKQLTIDQDKLLVKEEKSVPDQPVHSSELQVLEALRRRGIAMACVDIVSWEAHEKYLQKLFNHLRGDAPENFSKPTLQQILKADRQVFMQMIKDDVSVRRLPDNTLEMDTAIFAALSTYEVGFHLIPLPKTSKPVADPNPYRPPKRQHWYDDDTHPYNRKGKGKGKGKKGKNRPANPMPQALQGRNNVSMDNHNRRLCFNYNLGKCSDAAHGAQCAKGFHLCMRKDCHAPHPECEHDKS